MDNVPLAVMANVVTGMYNEIKDMQSITEKYDYIEKKDKTFLSHFPIVFKYMLIDKYCPDAFAYVLKYRQDLLIDNAQNHGNDNNINLENYYKVQAEYARQLHINSNFSKKKLQKIYDDNYEEAKNLYQESAKIVSDCNKSLSDDRKKRLTDFIKRELKI